MRHPSETGPNTPPHLHYSTATRIRDAADQSRLISGGWLLRYEQVSRGAFEGHLRQGWIEGIHLFSERLSQAVFQNGQGRQDSLCLGLFADTALHARWRGEAIGPDHIMCITPGMELQVSTPVDSHLLSLCVPLKLLPETATQLAATRHDPELARVMRTFVVQAMHTLASHPLAFARHEARRQFQEDAVALAVRLLSHAPVPDRIPQAKARQVVERTRRHIADHADTAIGVDDLCQLTHTSRRTLQSCFEQVVGTSPAAYVKIARLNGVRRDLLRAGGQRAIADIASDWGFWHFSQFAVDYRRLFGEQPSATVRYAARRKSANF